MADFDLNLIVTFVTLYEAQNITIAAERLCITQPSVSCALTRFREQFDDALFVRNQQGMQPTRLTTQLCEGFKETGRSISDAASEAHKSSPSTSKQRSRLTLSDLDEIALLPRVLGRLNQVAPNIEPGIVPLEIDQVATWLDDGHIDAAICSQVLPGAGITHQRLMSEQYCCLVSDAHPRIGTQMNMQQFLTEPHAIVTRTSGHGMIEDVLRKVTVKRRVRLHVPYFSVLPRIILGTKMITILPCRVAWGLYEFLGDRPSKVIDLSFEVPSFEVTLHWHSRSEKSASLKWFYEQIEAVLDEPQDRYRQILLKKQRPLRADGRTTLPVSTGTNSMMEPPPGGRQRLFYSFNLGDHVPVQHLLRSIDQCLDLRDLLNYLADFYGSIGRSSIGPELMMRILIIDYCYVGDR